MKARIAVVLALLWFSAAAFAGPPFVQPEATFPGGGPITTNNDAGCDIGLYPAATLLLPYFEVDVSALAGVGETTLFTITNTTNVPQVAHVTLWTDWSYPVLDFNIYLTGYDVQSINLFDLIVRGRIAPDSGTGSAISPVGALSGDTVTDTDRDNPLLNEASCVVAAPVQLTFPYITRMQQAFTLGRVPAFGSLAACNTVGGTHENAVGYVTIDVVDSCTTLFPTDEGYFANDILFDNVLMGDYQQVNGAQDYAQGGPMVHIRAIPEGGSGAQRVADQGKYKVNFTRTFYSRLQPAATQTFDARQPLPSTFATRWIEAGSSSFQTFYKVWREARTSAGAPCVAYPDNGQLGITEIVRFDEEENPAVWPPPSPVCTPIPFYPVLPTSALVSTEDVSVFPDNFAGDVAGWFYLNLDHCNQDAFATQGWIIASMRAEGRYSVDFDALALGNGCTPPLPQSQAYDPAGPAIGPAANLNP